MVEIIEVNAARWRGSANPRRPRRGEARCAQLVVVRFVGERHERGEAVRFVLQFAQPAQVVDPLRRRLDVAVEHRAGAPLAHLVPGAVDFEPFLGALLAAANLVAHFGIENLRAAAGQRTQPRLAQNLERLADRLLRDPLGEMPDFDRGEGLDGRDPGRRPSAPGPSPCSRKTAAWDAVRRRCAPR